MSQGRYKGDFFGGGGFCFCSILLYVSTNRLRQACANKPRFSGQNYQKVPKGDIFILAENFLTQ